MSAKLASWDHCAVEDLRAAIKRAVHDSSWETTPMTALKQQIMQKAHPVPLQVILCQFNTIKVCPKICARDGH